MAGAKKGLHNPIGVRCHDWCDGTFRDRRPIAGRWVGILHNVVSYPSPNPFACRILALEDLVDADFFRRSLETCLGLWTLCRHTARFLADRVPVPVCPLVHPAHPAPRRFRPDAFIGDPKIVTIGQWMRIHGSISHLDSRFPRYVVRAGDDRLYRDVRNGVVVVDYLPAAQYDLLLSGSLVYLDFYDLAACNTILECIMSSTPVLVRKLPAATEYLGADYPLFFEDHESASAKASDVDLIVAAHEHLAGMDKDRFSIGSFCAAMADSDVYRRLPASKPF